MTFISSMPDFTTDAPPGFGMSQCWRNRTSMGGSFQGRCSKSVDPLDMLGLCPEHIEELRDTNEATIRTEQLDNEAVLC